MGEIGVPTLCTGKNPHITLQSAFPNYSSTSAIQPSVDLDHVILKYIFILKNPHICGPMQFKPMLFKGQLYFNRSKLFVMERYSTNDSSFFRHSSLFCMPVPQPKHAGTALCHRCWLPSSEQAWPVKTKEEPRNHTVKLAFIKSANLVSIHLILFYFFST